MPVKPNNPPPFNMELAPEYENRQAWTPPPRFQNENRQIGVLPMRTMGAPRVTETNGDIDSYPEQVNAGLRNGMDMETESAVVYRMDKLVQDLLASQKSLKDEKKKVADKDAEIAQLEREVAYLQGVKESEVARAGVWDLERIDALNSASCKEVDELRQLLAFHKTNGEQVSKKLRELQATNKDLETQLQATEAALQENMSLLSELGISAKMDDGCDSQK